MKRYLGIDVGGSSIKYGVFNEAGVEYPGENGHTPTIKDSLESVLSTLVAIINEFDNLDGVGLSIPGGVNSETNTIIEGGAIPPIGGVKIGELLKERTGVDVVIENDANCVALAEKWIGNGVNARNLVCVTIGSGIGGGIIIDHKLYTGSNFFAGEFGYMIHREFAEYSDIEIMSANSASIPMIKAVAAAKNVPYETLDGKKVFAMLADNDPVVQGIYDRWIRALSTGILNIGFALDPDTILIGGGVSAVPRIIEDVRREVAAMNKYSKHWHIDVCKQFNDAGKIGAAYNCMMKD
ncbi:ROK family protein [Erysipelothrix sp. HDW6C]|uniref:ROK family protein n=1 Tax=Erysipelothrix sp. HDW6C TaxID=2714930 RepID=UPI00140B1BC4|nr:ROK family protein [Erysipelothrix sp. HDW6C]QIK68892.1 ROK family protein [Erysipelothrix sp. HDW6C]